MSLTSLLSVYITPQCGTRLSMCAGHPNRGRKTMCPTSGLYSHVVVDSAGMRSFWRCKVRSGTVIEPVWNYDLCPADFCSSSRIWPDIRTSMTESLIHLGDNMETIEDVERRGTVLANEAQIGLPHI